MVEGNKNLLFERNIIVLLIVTSYHDGKGEICVANTQFEKRIISEGMLSGRAECLVESNFREIADTSDNLITLKDTSKSLIDYSLMATTDLSNEQIGKLSKLLRTFSGVFTKALKSPVARANVKRRINTGNYAPIHHRARLVSQTERRIPF
ncbi:hypothetical protein AVEN_66166-1 [Araneus ventricosus]|uniref:Uncharacterized protein n=1 Tax=Araneus ventricosus TaxID=182803 RepID=A0A4Y2U609_ARAVE|nr:hypothetical protein AVEN_66166-1 [Araneus ventricosus]